jgi:hypothetical protein
VLVASGSVQLERLFLAAHVACAVVGFGGLALHSLTVARLGRFDGAEAYAVARADYSRARLAEKFLYVLPVAGIGAVWASDGRIGFGEAWLGIAAGVYVVALAVLHGVLGPARRRLLVLLGGLAGEPVSTEGPRRVELGAVGRRLSLGSAVLDLLFVVALVLMIWQPGG